MHERLKGLNIPLSQFRTNLRNELLLQQVREREVDNRVRVTEQDIDAYLAEQARDAAGGQLILNLAQVLVAVPENASAAVVAERRAKADEVLRRAKAGEDFAALARSQSDAAEGKAQGGELGRRPADRYPSLFLDAVQSARAGDVVGPLRSAAGFHILKVLEKRSAGLPDMYVTQTHVRHILLRPTAAQDEAATVARLNDMRQRIVSGQATFEALAGEFSQDGSAKQGGELGWARPGLFVPEFEEAMNALAPGQISQPVVSRFGVHLIQVLERRDVPLSQREQREAVRGVVRARKIEEAYTEWARDLRARAFIEFREPPQ
jgi:peptidyl-prolyl cis-trans isomerase SurA